LQFSAWPLRGQALPPCFAGGEVKVRAKPSPSTHPKGVGGFQKEEPVAKGKKLLDFFEKHGKINRVSGLFFSIPLIPTRVVIAETITYKIQKWTRKKEGELSPRKNNNTEGPHQCEGTINKTGPWAGKRKKGCPLSFLS